MPITFPLKPLNPGGQVSAGSVNRLQQMVQSLMRMVGLNVSAAGVALHAPPGPIWAELVDEGPGTSGVDSATPPGPDTSSGSSSSSSSCSGYAGRQIIRDSCGAWLIPGNGHSSGSTGLPAFELNGLTVPLTTNGHPTRVQLWPDGNGESMVFSAGNSALADLDDSSSSSGSLGNCTSGNSASFEYVAGCNSDGTPCIRRMTINAAVPIRVCDEEVSGCSPGSSSSDAGSSTIGGE